MMKKVHLCKTPLQPPSRPFAWKSVQILWQCAGQHNVCLTVYRGEILALLGENGSGKTTLVNMLSGIYRPDSGRISVMDVRYPSAAPRKPSAWESA